MDSQLRRNSEKTRKRGRPAGRNRVPLSAEERRARNAQYERERRDQQAEAMLELADAMGCDPNLNNADIMATVVSYLSHVSSRNANDVTNDDLRRQNETMIREIGLFNEQWGVSVDDNDSDTSDSGVIIESAESDSGDSSSSSSFGYSHSSAIDRKPSVNFGPGLSSDIQPTSFSQEQRPNEILRSCQSTVSSDQATSYDEPWASYDQSAAKRFETFHGYVEGSNDYSQIPVSYGQDSSSYSQASASYVQPNPTYKREVLTDDEGFSCYDQGYGQLPVGYGQESMSYGPIPGNYSQKVIYKQDEGSTYVQDTAGYGKDQVSYVQTSGCYDQSSTNYVQPQATYKQESGSEEEGSSGNQGSARTRPYVKSCKRFKLERASSAASTVSEETSPQQNYGLEGSMPPGLGEKPIINKAQVFQGSWPQILNTWSQAPPHAWSQEPQAQYYPAVEVVPLQPLPAQSIQASQDPSTQALHDPYTQVLKDPSTQTLRVPLPQDQVVPSPQAIQAPTSQQHQDPWMDTLIMTYLR